MRISMLDHLQEWIFHFIGTHEGLGNENAIRFSVPPYHHLTPTNMSYEDVPLWNGKEMKEMRRNQLGVEPSLHEGEAPPSVPYSFIQLSEYGHC